MKIIERIKRWFKTIWINIFFKVKILKLVENLLKDLGVPNPRIHRKYTLKWVDKVGDLIMEAKKEGVTPEVVWRVSIHTLIPEIFSELRISTTTLSDIDLDSVWDKMDSSD